MSEIEKFQAIPVEKHRKFHDLWAIVLYGICYVSSLTACLIVGFGAQKNAGSGSGMNGDVLKLIVTSFIMSLVFTIIGLMLTYLFYTLTEHHPKTVIYTTYVVLLVSTCISCLSTYPLGAKAFFSSLVGGLFAILMESLIFYFTIYRNIELIAVIASTVSKIFKKYYIRLAMFFFALFFVAMLLAEPLLTLQNAEKYQISILAVFGALVYLWTYFIFKYISAVVACSVVVEEINDHHAREGKVLSKALRNTRYALGSISVGALLTAIITLISGVVASKKNEAENAGRAGASIGWAVLGFFVSILEEAILLMNIMVFPYLSVHGTSYFDSIKGSGHEFLYSNGSVAIGIIRGLEYVINLFEFLVFILLFGGCIGYIFIMGRTPAVICSGIIGMLIALIFIFLVLEVFSAGALALLYVHSINPTALKSYSASAEKVFKENPLVPINKENKAVPLK